MKQPETFKIHWNWVLNSVLVLILSASFMGAASLVSTEFSSYRELKKLPDQISSIAERLTSIEATVKSIATSLATTGPETAPTVVKSDMINHTDLKRFVIQPTLDLMVPLWGEGVNREAATNLLLGTVFQESVVGNQTRLKQIGGPALGIFQIEPNTHQDIWDNYLATRDDKASFIRGLA